MYEKPIFEYSSVLSTIDFIGIVTIIHNLAEIDPAYVPWHVLFMLLN